MATALEEINIYIALNKDIPEDILMHLCEYTAQLETTNAELLEALKVILTALQAWETECPDSWDLDDIGAVSQAKQAIRHAEENE